MRLRHTMRYETALVVSWRLSHNISCELARFLWSESVHGPSSKVMAAIQEAASQAGGGVFVRIDEAYHHYVGESADYASFIDRPVDDRRVIVTRTFSKIHGLAVVGYGMRSPPPRPHACRNPIVYRMA